ncbi:MAG: GNAT family N-acetyltransferase [Saccharospirillaceae bacterium]|nr:GNAT family N-acetyltransferase [Pseudomonadales bacterium]NRB77953.1 GNAT family N-acetyltransferase [Saccharospirillaceae bacterium]
MIREMNIDDHSLIIELFKLTPGVTIRDSDSIENTKNYLKRNPHLNFVKIIDNKIVGCVMCGHDGRRGYLQYLLILPKFRKHGIGESLFKSCIDSLQKIGILKTHIFVFKQNSLANTFWKNKGWILRDDLNMYSLNQSVNDNA